MRRVLFVRDLSLSSLPPSLAHLDLSGCPGLTDAGVRRLTANCPRLVSLSLSYTRVTDRHHYLPHHRKHNKDFFNFN